MKTKFFDRTIKELQGQLEYERLRREKLECQLDESRVEVDQLKEMLLEKKARDAYESKINQLKIMYPVDFV